MQSFNRGGLQAAVLTMSFVQMATNAAASILADIAQAFPEASDTAVQYLMTFPNLFVVVMSVLTGWFSARIAKRSLAILGLTLVCISGLAACLIHGRLVLLYVWAGSLGIGIGLVIPIATSLISDWFDGIKRDALLGYQTSAANIGSMLMTYFAGVLAMAGWHYSYLVYLLAIPGLVLTILFVPRFRPERTGEEKDDTMAESAGTRQLPQGLAFWLIAAAVFMLLFYVGPTNFSMLVAERELGGSMIAGSATTILLAGGTAMGLLYGRVARWIGTGAIPLGFFALAIGYGLIFRVNSIPALYIGSLLVGSGNTLVLPCCMGSVLTQDKAQSTFLMSLIFSIANLGTFLTPVITALSAAVMRSGTVTSRIGFAAIAAAVCMVISTICLLGLRWKDH